jgi:long-chain fatty acid transport protein
MSKRTSAFSLAAILALTSFAAANGFNLNGLGTRAQGMGGAFVSIADDFSAVFWNPAGAAGFRREMFGFHAADLIPRATYNQFSELPGGGIDAKTPTQHYLGFLGAYYRPISSKVVVGIGVGTPSGLGVSWDGEDFINLSGGTTYDWSSRVGLFAFSPLIAVKINERLSAGAAINVNHGSFQLKRPGGEQDLGEGPVDLGQYEENMNGWGLGAAFGLLARPIDRLSIGLTVRTPSTVSFKGSARMSYLSLYELPDSSDLERKITWPLWIAGGVSFRPIERLLLSADVHWTQWSKLDRISTEYLDPVWRELFALGGVLDGSRMILSWKDSTQIRFGAEYRLNGTTVLRAGYANDPAPGPDTTLNVLLPTHTFNVFSAGLGKILGDLRLDFGLDYMAGNTRTPPSNGYPIEGPPSSGMNNVVPSVSVQFQF